MSQSTPFFYSAGNSGAALTINWNNGEIQKVTLTAACTLTLSNPLVMGSIYVLELAQDGTGGWQITWPGSVLWGDAGAPTLSGANKTDLVNLYWNGTNYLGSYATGY